MYPTRKFLAFFSCTYYLNEAVLPSEISNCNVLRLAGYQLATGSVRDDYSFPVLNVLFLGDPYKIVCNTGTPNLFVGMIPTNNKPQDDPEKASEEEQKSGLSKPNNFPDPLPLYTSVLCCSSLITLHTVCGGV